MQLCTAGCPSRNRCVDDGSIPRKSIGNAGLWRPPVAAGIYFLPKFIPSPPTRGISVTNQYKKKYILKIP
ncbi:hypothetical protein Nmel_016744 [Mimus melanotis]